MCFAALTSIAVKSNAQSTVAIQTVAGDTLTNTDTVTISLPTITGNYAAISVTAAVISLSASNTGYAQLSFSDNGTDWDTLTRVIFNAVARPFKIWTFTPTSHQYHRVKFYTSGTQSGVAKVWYKLGKSITAAVHKPIYNILASLHEAVLPEKVYLKRKAIAVTV